MFFLFVRIQGFVEEEEMRRRGAMVILPRYALTLEIDQSLAPRPQF